MNKNSKKQADTREKTCVNSNACLACARGNLDTLTPIVERLVKVNDIQRRMYGPLHQLAYNKNVNPGGRVNELFDELLDLQYELMKLTDIVRKDATLSELTWEVQKQVMK